jgi:hypothetical protein
MNNLTMENNFGINPPNRKPSFRSKLQSVQGRNQDPDLDGDKCFSGQESLEVSYLHDSMKISKRNDFGCGPESFLRKNCIAISRWKWFDCLVMLAAVAHSSKGTKLHFKSPTAERRHVLCVGVGGDRTHAGPLQKSRPSAGYARPNLSATGGIQFTGYN